MKPAPGPRSQPALRPLKISPPEFPGCRVRGCFCWHADVLIRAEQQDAAILRLYRPLSPQTSPVRSGMPWRRAPAPACGKARSRDHTSALSFFIIHLKHMIREYGSKCQWIVVARFFFRAGCSFDSDGLHFYTLSFPIPAYLSVFVICLSLSSKNNKLSRNFGLFYSAEMESKP